MPIDDFSTFPDGVPPDWYSATSEPFQYWNVSSGRLRAAGYATSQIRRHGADDATTVKLTFEKFSAGSFASLNLKLVVLDVEVATYNASYEEVTIHTSTSLSSIADGTLISINATYNAVNNQFSILVWNESLNSFIAGGSKTSQIQFGSAGINLYGYPALFNAAIKSFEWSGAPPPPPIVPTFNLRAKSNPANIDDYSEAVSNPTETQTMPIINWSEKEISGSTYWNGVVSGWIEAVYSEEYTFIINSYNYGQMYLDDVRLDQNEDLDVITATATLIAGRKYAFKVHHNSIASPELLRVEWYSNSQAQEFVPACEPPPSIPPASNVEAPQRLLTYQPWTDFAVVLEDAPLMTPELERVAAYNPWGEQAEVLPDPTVIPEQVRHTDAYFPWGLEAEALSEPQTTPHVTENFQLIAFPSLPAVPAQGQYERFAQETAPWWFQGAGLAFLSTVGALHDDLHDWLVAATEETMTGLATRPTLEAKARDRGLFVVPNEPLETLRERVRTAFDLLEQAGTLPGLRLALEGAGWNARILELYTTMPTDAWYETALDVWDETTTEVWDGGEAQMFTVFVWQRTPNPLPIADVPMLIDRFKSAESVLKKLFLMPANWNSSTPDPWETAGTLIYGA